MNGTLARKALRRSLDQIRYVSAVRPGAAPGPVARVYDQVERDFGMLAPPVALHSPAPGPLAACWVMLRETLLASGAADRAAKETVAASVSHSNACPYCVSVHAAGIRALVKGDAAEAVAAGRSGAVADLRLRAIGLWAQASAQRAALAGLDAPCPADEMLELAGVAVTFHYLNRMVNVFLGESPLPAGLPSPVRRGMMGLLGRIMLPEQRRALDVGRALDLLPEAGLPPDMSWAAASPAVAAAFARAAAVIDRAGTEAVPSAVRDLVLEELAGWDGEPRGPSRAWADGIISPLPQAEQPAARLALLTAFASYQVTPSDIADFRKSQPEDAALVGLTSWASLAAARRIGTWVGSVIPVSLRP
jgi:AhpD family alkylhydroperoxidase